MTGGTAVLSAAQATALLDNLSLGTVVDNADGSGSVGWTYSVPNSEIDFLGAGETVELTFTVQIDDGNSGTDTQDVVITITGTNDTPIIDSAAQSGSITETVDSAPLADAAPADATGTITFDDVDLSDSPTASILAGASVTGGTAVLSAAQATALLDNLSLGTVVDNADGSGSVGWTYSVPNSEIDFLGAGETVELTFTVQIDDGNSGTDTQDVVITITGTNDTPIIDSAAQSGSITETVDSAPLADAAPADATGTITFDDVDLSDSPTASILAGASVTGGTAVLSAAQATALLDNLSLGTVVDNADGSGSVGWTYSVPNSEIDFLGAGETVELTFTVQIDDGNSGTDTQDVVITITGTNDTPIIDSAAQSGSITETVDSAPLADAAPADATGTITFDDVDLSDSPTASILAGASVTGGTAVLSAAQATALLDNLSLGTVVDNADGSGSVGWTYSVPNSEIDFLGAGETVELTFTVQIDDGNSGTDTQDVVITITGTNDTPIIDSAAQSGSITETVDSAPLADAAPADATGTITFDDVDLSDSPTASILAGASVTGGTAVLSAAQATALLDNLSLGTVVDNADGSGSVGWTYSVPNSEIDFLGAGETVELTFTVQIDDGNSGTDTQDVVITITGTNDTPIIDSAAQSGSITETVDSAPLADAAPADATGTITFDDVDLSDSPTASILAGASVTGGTAVLSAAQATALLDNLSLGTVVDNADGSGSVGWTYSVPNSEIDFLGAGETVELTFTVQIDDGNSGTDTQDVVITITGTNDTPIIDSAAQSGSITETVDSAPLADAAPADATGTITFDDVDLSDSPTASILAGASVTGGTAVLSAAQATALLDNLSLGTVVDNADGSGSVGWTYSVPNSEIDFLGAGETVELTFTVQIDDGNSGTDTQDVVITITGTNDTPIIDSAAQSGSITETVDSAPLADAAPADATGTITFDDVDLSDSPTASILAGASVTGGTAVLSAAQATALLDNLSLGTVVDNADGSGSVGWTYSVPNSEIDFLGAGETVELTFTVQIDDGNSGTDTQDVVITITGTNDTPIIDSAAQSGSITETVDSAPLADAAPADATGTITFDDVDLSDSPTASILAGASVTGGTAVLSAAQATALLDNLSLGTVVDNADGSGSVGWTYSVPNSEIDFLGAGETVELTFTVQIDDGNSGTDTQDVVITITGTNDTPIIDSAAQSGSITETVDSAPLADAAPADATGTITFDDVDLSDSPTASILAGASVTGGTAVLSAAQATALLDNLSLGTVVDNADGSGSVGWTYSVPNSEIDFLGAGETVELTFTVQIDDGNSGTDTQDVVITITGTNDTPIIDSAAQSGSITETVDSAPLADAAPADATGTITFDDVDLSDSPTASILAGASVTGGTAVLSAAQATALLDNLSLGTVVDNADGSGSVGWTYSVPNSEIDFLGAGETVELTFTVQIDDGNSGTDTQDVVITITGTNDTPIIDSAAQSGSITETVDSAPLADAAPADATGTITFDDVDLSDSPTASILAGASVTGGTAVLSAAQATALLDNLSLGTVVDNADGSGSVGWTYSVPNSEIDFLGAGETVELTFTVQIDDGNSGTDTQDVVITITGTNDTPIIDSAAQSGSITETVDSAPLADAAPADATGTITFDDVDLSDSPTASILAGASVTGGTAVLSAAQATALLDNLSLGTVVDNADGSGSVGWTYSVPNSEIDFLGAGETVELTFTVQIDDGNSGTDTQDVVITITGTNDTPIIDSAAQSGSITETVDSAPLADAAPADATGTITFDDVDLSDSPTASILAGASVTGGTAVLSAAQATALLDNLSLGTVVDNADGSGSVGWTYSVPNSEIDFLGAGETVELTFTVQIDDGNSGTDTQDVVITITGTNDTPIIDSAAQSGSITETVDSAPLADAAPADATGTITFDDVDLSDSPTASILAGASVTGGTAVLSAAQATALLDNLSLGTVVDNADGSGSVGWTYSVPNSEIDFLGAGETVELTFTVQIDDGNSGTDTQDVVITITGTNDAPDVVGSAATVSEEGLTHGIADTTGNTDTTDTVTASGTISATDPDAGDTLSYTFGTPSAVLKSGGVTVTWTGAGTDTLVGSAGGNPILTATIDEFRPLRHHAPRSNRPPGYDFRR